MYGTYRTEPRVFTRVLPVPDTSVGSVRGSYPYPVTSAKKQTRIRTSAGSVRKNTVPETSVTSAHSWHNTWGTSTPWYKYLGYGYTFVGIPGRQGFFPGGKCRVYSTLIHHGTHKKHKHKNTHNTHTTTHTKTNTLAASNSTTHMKTQRCSQWKMNTGDADPQNESQPDARTCPPLPPSISTTSASLISCLVDCRHSGLAVRLTAIPMNVFFTAGAFG